MWVEVYIWVTYDVYSILIYHFGAEIKNKDFIYPIYVGIDETWKRFEAITEIWNLTVSRSNLSLISIFSIF